MEHRIPGGDYKDTNPKDSVGIKKFSMSTIPSGVLAEVAVGMLEGAVKYGRHNYREAGVRWSVYHDAAQRHLMAFQEGQDDDPDSLLCHITKVITCMIVLRDSMIQGNWVDDRPPKSPPGWVQEMNQRTARLVDMYPNPPPACTQLARDKAARHDSD
jgi:hypothetical protein